MGLYSYGSVAPVAHPDAWRFADHPLAATPIPPRFDLFASGAPRLKNQGPTSSCVGHAISTGLEALYLQRGDGSVLSAKMVWTLARIAERAMGQDVGVDPHDALVGVNAAGVCLDSEFPINGTFTDIPSAAADAEALARSGVTFTACTSLDECRTAAALANTAVVLSIAVYAPFESPLPDGTFAAMSGQVLGYHAILLRSYDVAARQNRIRNSWGPWGAGGEGIFSDDQFTQCVTGAWALQLAPVPAPQPKPPVPSTAVHLRYAPLFTWFLDPAFHWTAAQQASIHAWQADLDANCVLR